MLASSEGLQLYKIVDKFLFTTAYIATSDNMKATQQGESFLVSTNLRSSCPWTSV